MPAGDQHSRGLRVLVADERGRRMSAPGVARWLARIAPARARGVVSVALVSDARVRGLNRRFRGVDRATDVLSFPISSSSAPAHSSSPPRTTQRTQRKNPGWPSVSSVVESFLGDIVIATGVARRQARAAGHSELTELRVLALHGLLHLLGYDHDRDSGRMAEAERRLRRKGGLREGLIERGRRRSVLETPERYGARASGTGGPAPRRRSVPDMPERDGARASGVGVGPHASK